MVLYNGTILATKKPSILMRMRFDGLKNPVKQEYTALLVPTKIRKKVK
jgi:hypothetical protein